MAKITAILAIFFMHMRNAHEIAEISEISIISFFEIAVISEISLISFLLNYLARNCDNFRYFAKTLLKIVYKVILMVYNIVDYDKEVHYEHN